MSDRATDTQLQILEAARGCLLAEGYAKLSTRKVADAAGVPLSQIHYHFGGKQGLVLALLDHENTRLVDRQQRMYAADAPLWKRYEQACDFLEDDIASGYVRVLQELIAASWADKAVAKIVRAGLMGWVTLLTDLARQAENQLGTLGPFSPEEVGVLIGSAFVGAESAYLLGMEKQGSPVRQALRRVGDLIRAMEARQPER